MIDPGANYDLQVYIAIFADRSSVDLLNDRIGLAASVIKRKGEIPRPGAAKIKANTWILYSGVDANNSTISAQFQGLSEKIGLVKQNFKLLPEDACTIVKCVTYGYKFLPEMTFEADHLRLVLAINAKLDIAVYDLTAADVKAD